MDDLDVNDANETLNYTEVDEGQYEYQPNYFVPSIFAIIFVVGVVGNGVLVLFFISNPKRRVSPNTYIVSLAVGDLFSLFFCVPFVSVIFVTHSWPFGTFMCQFSELVKNLSINVTVITLTVLSVERYLVIADPLNRRPEHRQSDTFFIIGIWLLSLILALPSACIADTKLYYAIDNNYVPVCTPYPMWTGELYPKIDIMLKMLLLYAIPLIVISLFYCMMAWQLFKPTSDVVEEGLHRRVERKNAARMVLAFVLIFAICFLPNHVYHIWSYFNPNYENDFNNFWYMFRIVGFCLLFINSCTNPVALYCVSDTFRKYFNHHLFCGVFSCVVHSSTESLTLRPEESNF